jgi:hypothetical protein
MTTRSIADVAELADAQVSEACDGDIVEVQVLSSAPGNNNLNGGSVNRTRRFFVCNTGEQYSEGRIRSKKYLSRIFDARCSRIKRSMLKGEY